MLVSCNEDGSIRAKCFRSSCNLTEYRRAPTLSLKELAARKQAAYEAARTATVLPMGCTPVIPPQAAVWFLRAGVGGDVAQRWGFQWNARLGRVVVPVHDDTGARVSWIARGVGGGGPKYISPATTGSKKLYGGLPSTYSRIILVEDPLSCIRINELRLPVASKAILGTRIDRLMLGKIVSYGVPVDLWMDPDRAGRASSIALTKKLKLFGLMGRVIAPGCEPKEMTNKEIIRTILND